MIKKILAHPIGQARDSMYDARGLDVKVKMTVLHDPRCIVTIEITLHVAGFQVRLVTALATLLILTLIAMLVDAEVRV